MERKQYTRLDAEAKAELIQMYKDGANQYDLAEMFGVAQTTVSRIIRLAGIDRTHKGGAISRYIDVAPTLNAEDALIPKKQAPSLRILERTVVLRGSVTPLTYTLKTGESSVILGYEENKLEIDIALIDALIEELKAIKEWM